mmetsp:Transcript_37866/g.79594  ORF Transcript_37866/g.79594 Transcript_37866/m.79594 type:complete len:94 (-) Transcript_37866:378-659(-)|eukprot:6181101-Pleurochrysis_carterae.AAC.2
MAETYDKKPTLHAQLKQMGMSKDEYCSTVSENAELAGLASSRAIEEFCRQGKAPIKRSGSVGNNKMPEGLKQYWNYETKGEKEARGTANVVAP